MVVALILGFIFSFLGSIPPGTINLTVLQLALERRHKIAFRFSIAAALVEFPYCWIAIKFSTLIINSPVITSDLHLITGVVMLLFGALNLLSTRRPHAKVVLKDSGFRRGLLLGILNPMTIPFWVAMTAFLRSHHWLVLESPAQHYGYLLGVSLGAFTLLLLLNKLAGSMADMFTTKSRVQFIPGVVLVGLGFYSLLRFIW